MDGRCGLEDVSFQLIILYFNASESLIERTPDSRWVDQMGNVHGRAEGINPSEKALLIGSHLVNH